MVKYGAKKFGLNSLKYLFIYFLGSGVWVQIGEVYKLLTLKLRAY